MTQKGVTVTKRGNKTKAVLNQRTVGTSRAARGNGKEPNVAMRALTALISRLQLANRAGLQFGGKRDLYDVFGYKKQLTTDDFLSKYIRQDVASRIIDAPPDATWSNPPTMTGDAKIVTAWEVLVKEHDMWGLLNRVDRLSRLNHFAIILFGFDDGSEFDRAVTKADELLYVRAVGSRQITKVTFNSDRTSPRFGLPEMYEVQFDDPALKTVSAGTITVEGLKDMKLHASRTVHIVEKPLEDVVFGTPIIERVYNLLDDLLKVGGGTAEIYWLSARAGLQADIDKEMDIDPADAAALADEIEEYQHELRRVMRTRGVTLKVLESKVPNPAEIFDMLMGLISGTTGIPRRILLGSEAGELASAQDRANWAERIDERRKLFSEPRILRPTVDILQNVGLLPEGEVEFEWPSAFLQNPLEEGQTKAQTARAIGNISRQTGAKTPMQLTSRKEAREIIGLEGDLPENELLDQEPEPPTPTGAAPGLPPDEVVPPGAAGQ